MPPSYQRFGCCLEARVGSSVVSREAGPRQVASRYGAYVSSHPLCYISTSGDSNFIFVSPMLVKCDECVVRACVVWIIANTLRPNEFFFSFLVLDTRSKRLYCIFYRNVY